MVAKTLRRVPQHPVRFLVAVLLAIFATSVNAVKCPNGSLIYLDKVRIEGVLIESLEVKDAAFHRFVSDRRRERMEHLKRTLLETSSLSSSFVVASVKQDPKSCFNYESDLSKLTSQNVTHNPNLLTNNVFLGAASTVLRHFKGPHLFGKSPPKNAEPSVPVTIIFAERFSVGNKYARLRDAFTCTSKAPLVSELVALSRYKKVVVIYVGPQNLASPLVGNGPGEWNNLFGTPKTLPNIPDSKVYPTTAMLKAGYYDRASDEMASYVRSNVVARICDNYDWLAKPAPERPCLTGTDYALEVVWLFNPHSTNDNHHIFSETVAARYMLEILDRLKSLFSEVKAGVAMFGEYTGTGSYTRVHGLTTDPAKVVNALQNAKLVGEGSSLKVPFLGVLGSLFDPEMGWSTASTNANGKKVLKVVLLSTDNVSLRPVYDGPDRGWEAPINDFDQVNTPLPAELGQILRQQDAVLGVLLTTPANRARWTDYVDAMTGEGANVALQVVSPSRPADVKNVTITRLVNPIERLLCTLSPTPSNTEAESSDTSANTSTPLTPPNPNLYQVLYYFLKKQLQN